MSFLQEMSFVTAFL